MIVIRVELWSAVTGQKSELARMVIDNVGGTNHLGDYRCRTLRGRSEEALDRALRTMSSTGTQREGRVSGHPRLREHVWNLVAKALTSMGYGMGKSDRAPLHTSEPSLPLRKAQDSSGQVENNTVALERKR